MVVTTSVYNLSLMARNVYDLENGVDERNLNAGLDDFYVILDSIEREGGGICCMAVWTNSYGKKVLAIKGTDLSNMSDIVNDVSMVLGGENSRYAVGPTVARALQLIKRYDVNMITGHSLGGYMAEIIATNHGIPGIAFCAPGTNGPATKLGGSVVEGFHNVNFEHDPAGNIMSGIYQHVQWSIFVKSPNDQYTHGIDYMVEYFSRREYLDNANIQSHCSSYPTGYYYPN